MEVPAQAGGLTGTAGPVRLLVVTAVAAERDAVARGLRPDGNANAGTQHPLAGALATLRLSLGRHGTADLLAAGVGPAAAAAGTATALTAAAAAGTPYTLAVSTGIAGGFAPRAPVGSVVVADEIIAADLGAQSPEGFVPVSELGFGTVRITPPAGLSRLVAERVGAPLGTVLTVSTVTGTAERARQLRDRHPGALAEAMEGFGVAEAAAAHEVPVLEVRSIANPVGPRDRAAWRIGDALAALADAFRALPPVLVGPAARDAGPSAPDTAPDMEET